MAIRRPNQFEHFEAKLPGVTVHYVREGSGPPLLLLHGHPGFWWEWYECLGELAKSFDVIAVDLRGIGDSEKPDLKDLSQYHLDVVTDDQANLLEYLGIERACVVGHDYSAAPIRATGAGHRSNPEGVSRNVTGRSPTTTPTPPSRPTAAPTWAPFIRAKVDEIPIPPERLVELIEAGGPA